MSFWSTLGDIGKTVLKVGGDVGGSFIGNPQLGNAVTNGLFSSSPAPAAAVPTAPPVGYNPYAAGYGVGAVPAPSLTQQLSDLLAVASGNKPIQTQVESSALPSWLLPVGLFGLLAVLFMAVSGGRR